MDEKQLMGLAAKAAGMKLGPEWDYFEKGILVNGTGRGDGFLFDPLNDDGDAFRLAVKLQLTICNEHLQAGVAYCTDRQDTDFPVVQSGNGEPEVTDEDYAATRRAIVLAAAEIGITK